MQVYIPSKSTKEIKADTEALFKRYAHTRDRETRNEIALLNIALIPYAVKKWNLYTADFLDQEEVYQHCFIKLLEAVERYSPEKGASFSTYAVACLRSGARGRTFYNLDLSLDAPVKGQDGEELTIADTVEDAGTPTPDDLVHSFFVDEAMEAVKNTLSPGEYGLLCRHYGIHCDKQNYRDIAKEEGVSHEAVLKAKNKAFNKIRKSKFFRAYYQEELERQGPFSYYKAMEYSPVFTSRGLHSDMTAKLALYRVEQEETILKRYLEKIGG